MDKDANKPADKREGSDRRQEHDPNFAGPDRRTGDRRKQAPPAGK